jgi:DNA invertase Pin-like site-specific DNA recombinase
VIHAPRGALTLADVREQTLTIVCQPCGRRGQCIVWHGNAKQAERKMISTRTKAALQAARARGVKLGGDRGNLALVWEKGRLAGLEVRRRA